MWHLREKMYIQMYWLLLDKIVSFIVNVCLGKDKLSFHIFFKKHFVYSHIEVQTLINVYTFYWREFIFILVALPRKMWRNHWKFLKPPLETEWWHSQESHDMKAILG